MAYTIVTKKRFLNKVVRVLAYLESEWSKNVADDFLAILESKLHAIQHHPYIGRQTGLKNIRSLHVTKHNRIYYRVKGATIAVMNLFDTRRKNYPGQ